MDLLSVKTVAEQSTVPQTTLYGWARTWETKPVGPRPLRLGPRQLRYRVEDIAAWLGVEPNELISLTLQGRPWPRRGSDD